MAQRNLPVASPHPYPSSPRRPRSPWSSSLAGSRWHTISCFTIVARHTVALASTYPTRRNPLPTDDERDCVRNSTSICRTRIPCEPHLRAPFTTHPPKESLLMSRTNFSFLFRNFIYYQLCFILVEWNIWGCLRISTMKVYQPQLYIPLRL